MISGDQNLYHYSPDQLSIYFQQHVTVHLRQIDSQDSEIDLLHITHILCLSILKAVSILLHQTRNIHLNQVCVSIKCFAQMCSWALNIIMLWEAVQCLHTFVDVVDVWSSTNTCITLYKSKFCSFKQCLSLKVFCICICFSLVQQPH